ncbi:MAG: hypothetical protein QM811_12810 [Pirellulales bacterium]
MRSRTHWSRGATIKLAAEDIDPVDATGELSDFIAETSTRPGRLVSPPIDPFEFAKLNTALPNLVRCAACSNPFSTTAKSDLRMRMTTDSVIDEQLARSLLAFLSHLPDPLANLIEDRGNLSC